MKTKLLFLCIFCIVLSKLSAQTIRYVKPVASGNGTGSSWGNADDDLQEAITNSVAGDQVWVAAGTYKPKNMGSSSRNSSFLLKSGVRVYGSFAGNESSVNQRAIAVNPTILSGDLTGNDVFTSNPLSIYNNSTMATNAYHVVVASGMSAQTVFDGFTITSGQANDTGTMTTSQGAGMYVVNSDGLYSNIIIKNCYAGNGGGGIYLTSDDYDYMPRFTGLTITNCVSGLNGGNDGSAVYMWSTTSDAEFFNMLVTNCVGYTTFKIAGSASITNATFYNLTSGSQSTSTAVIDGSADLSNCIFGQHTLLYDMQLFLDSAYTNNNSFYKSVKPDTDWHSANDVTNTGNPGFVDAANGDFRLSAGSPIIDSGDSQYLTTYAGTLNGYAPVIKDIAGNTRIVQTVDRGAYEFGQAAIRYVKQVASGNGDGSSWANASNDLQLMINSSSPNDQIWVAKGVYRPNRQPNATAVTPNNRENTFFLKSGVKIYGSFAGGETTIVGRQFQANATILSGDFSGNDPDNTANALAISNASGMAENAYHVVLGFRVDDIIFDGFVITGGVANGTGILNLASSNDQYSQIARDFGGGLYLSLVQGQLNNIAVRSSLAASGGGGIFNDNSSSSALRFNGLIISGCLGGITGAGKGSAFYGDGFGSSSSTSKSEIFNMLITNCVGSSAIYATALNSIIYMSNATIYGVSVNDANAVNAGVIETINGGSVIFNNSIIGLHAYPYAFNIGYSSTAASYSSYSSIYRTKRGQGTLTVTSNTTNTGNPGFINASAGDFGLLSTSAVRNLGNVPLLTTAAGTQYDYPAIKTDIKGNPRLFQGSLDLGAYQYKPSCEIPTAPTAADQSVCTGSTIASLTATGTSLKWYYTATGGSALSSSTALSTRAYFVSQSTGVCESDRVEIIVTLLTPPAAPSIGSQVFCGPSTVAKLNALNANYRWYAASTGGTVLAPTTALVNSTTYYASQVNEQGCEGARKAVFVTIGTIPAAPTATSSQLFCGTAKVSDLQSSATTPRWYTAMTDGFALSANTAISTGTYYVAQMGTYCESVRTAVEVTVTAMPAAPVAVAAQTFCGSGIVDNLMATGLNLKWYDSSGSGPGLTANTPLANGMYYVTQTINGCMSAATAVNVTIQALPAQPTASAQVLCDGSTVANLTAIGTNLKWYIAAGGGTALQANVVLTTGTYYVTQSNAAGCESARTAVQVTITPLPTAPGAAALQTFCGTVTVADLVSDAREAKWYATLTGGTSIPQDTPLTSGTYYGSQINVMCESTRTAVEVVVSPIPSAPTAPSQLFCGEATVAQLTATGDNLKWYVQAWGGNALSPNALLVTDMYYVSQTNNNCESIRTAVAVTVAPLPSAPAAEAQSFCGEATIAQLTATGDNLKWYAEATGGNMLSSSQSLSTGTYYVSQSNTNCESPRVAVEITVSPFPTAPAALALQTFCGSATIDDLVTEAPETKWYTTLTGGTSLPSGTAITNGTYYASQMNFLCEGPRTEVQVVTNTAPLAPSAENQVLCTNSTIADLTALGTNLAWYSQAEGGTAINETDPLVAGTYYVSQNNGCESSRTAVTVSLSENCSALLNEHCSAIAAFNTRLYTQSVSGAAAYRFHVTNGANVQVFESNVPSFKLNNLPSFAYNTVYTVKVSVLKGGVWSPYGRACTVSTSSLPTTKVMASQCGGTFTSFNTLIYADAVESATGYRFRVSDGITTQVIEKPTRVFNIKDITGHTYNKTYTVDVSIQINGAFGQYGPACTLSTPSQGFTQLSEGYCGITVTLFNTVIYADAMYQATAYRFRVSDGVTTSIIDKPTRSFTIKNIPGHTYGKTYTVDVAVEVSGEYTEYGPVCTLSTPALRLTQLSEGYCGSTVSTFGSLIYADEVYQATSYRFRVTNGVTTHIIDRPTRSFSLKNFPGYAYNVTYTVAVTALVNGNYNPYGQECTITAVQVSSMSQNKGTAATEAVTLTAYPNPYTDAFSIAMDTQGRDEVTVRAFDMTGKLVEDITVSPEELASQRLGSRYAAGIYNVIVTQGDYNKAFKIVKR